MCDFLSWTEYKGKLFYLTNFELNTRDGKNLRKKLGKNFNEEIKGHGAIKEYFGLPHGRCKDFECTDFSSSINFPPEIAERLKQGLFSQIGKNTDLLTQPALDEYKKITQPAWNEYKKITQPALDEYKKITQPAWNKYEKIKQSAWNKYKKITQSAWNKYKKITQSALDKYNKIKQSALDEYKKIEQPAWNEYKKIEQPAWNKYEKIKQSALDEYNKIEQSTFWKLFTDPKNRIKSWR